MKTILHKSAGFVCALIIGTVAASAAPALPAASFYVATDGNDQWSGKLAAPNKEKSDGPFATIARARDATRGQRSEVRGQKSVVVRGGTYRLMETLTFGPEDSDVVYAAAPGERPVFSGGRVITGWKKGEGKLWTAQIADVAAGKWYFHQLFVNGRRATRARTPNDGYLRTDGPLIPLVRDRKKWTPEMKAGFKFKEGDLKRWGNLDDVNIVAFHAWTASWHHIAALDEQAHTVRFVQPSGWPMSYWEKEQRYYVENFREALDSPGEWHLDRKTGVLSYWPRPGEDMRKAEVVAPALMTLVRFAGDPDKGKFVRGVRLVGLSFQHGDWEIPRDKPADGQAAVTFLDAAISANGALDCVLERCEIAHVGQYGINFARGCRGNRIEQCHIHDLGAGGVRLGEYARGGDLPTAEPVRTRGNVVRNCFIHDGGHVFHAGIGVWIGQSADNLVSHNEICDFYYSGMSIGWTWGYGPHEGRGNVAEFNHIHHIGKGVLSDMGGIYTLGTQPGSVLRNNVIHDVLSYSYGGWGLYTDEGSTDIVLENNVVYLIKTGGFHQHYGKENIVRNNIFALAAEPQIIRSRQEEHCSFKFEGNIVYQDKGPLLGGNWGNKNYQMDRNVYWRAGGEPTFAGAMLDEWRQDTAQDKSSIIADPKFVSVAKRDFRLRPDSPALKLGFKPIDTSTVGLVGDKSWVALPKKIKRPPTEFAVWKEVTSIEDDFEKTPVGSRPEKCTLSGADAPGQLAVTDETATSGRRSVKFVDAAGLALTWQPHLYYSKFNFSRGTLLVSFDLRVEKGALPTIECRDASSPYRVGPSLRVSAAGELMAGKQTLMTLPLGQWVHIEAKFAVGRGATGSYDLTVKPRGGEAKSFASLPFGHKDFQRLQWFGFISGATEKTVFYVDNVRIAPAKQAPRGKLAAASQAY
ncbi:MAG: right-handed parallel beta-helix repeat-containing protein [Verrucomicrobia bacterium]|nr:right-handed parallel beta-helix repeat-containing protein [Verrucomicrobiota bacterium]